MELPSDLRLRVSPPEAPESSEPQTASLFSENETEASPKERKLLALIKRDESIQIDELVEKLEGVLSSAEIFASLFELELSGKIKQLPGKNFVRSF